MSKSFAKKGDSLNFGSDKWHINSLKNELDI